MEWSDLTPEEREGVLAVRRFDVWYERLDKVQRRWFWALPRWMQIILIMQMIANRKSGLN